MAKLTSNQTAAAILAHLQTPHTAQPPLKREGRPMPGQRPHPWYCRYDAVRKKVFIYLPAGSVSGSSLNTSGLTAHEVLQDWYEVPFIDGGTTSSTIFPSWKVVVSLATVSGVTTPTFYTDEAAIPNGSIVVAETRDAGSGRPVRQYVVGAITRGIPEIYLPGPLQISIDPETGDGVLSQRWFKFADGVFTQVDRVEGIDAFPRPTGFQSTATYAFRANLYSHAADHTDGVVTVKPVL